MLDPAVSCLSILSEAQPVKKKMGKMGISRQIMRLVFVQRAEVLTYLTTMQRQRKVQGPDLWSGQQGMF